MTTDTDLANYALAHLGIQKVTDIADDGSASALSCAEFMPQVKQEILREHVWTCATQLVALSEVTPIPPFKWSHRYQLPSDYLRTLDLNSYPWGYGTEYFELRGKELFTDWDSVQLRYVRDIEVWEMDPLLAEAISVKLASKLAVPLACSLQVQQQMFALYQQTVSKAKQANAIEQGAPDNRPLGQMYSKSMLVQARYRYGYSLNAHGFYFAPWA